MGSYSFVVVSEYRVLAVAHTDRGILLLTLAFVVRRVFSLAFWEKG